MRCAWCGRAGRAPALAATLALLVVLSLAAPLGFAQSVPAADGAAGVGTSAALAVLAPLMDPPAGGRATLLQNGATTTLVVVLTGLAPGSAHAGAIRAGGCAGPVLFPLEPVVADATGSGRAGMAVSAPLDAGAWWVQYHGAESLSSPAIACGPVRATDGAGPEPDGSRCPEREGVALERCG